MDYIVVTIVCITPPLECILRAPVFILLIVQQVYVFVYKFFPLVSVLVHGLYHVLKAPSPIASLAVASVAILTVCVCRVCVCSCPPTSADFIWPTAYTHR